MECRKMRWAAMLLGLLLVVGLLGRAGAAEPGAGQDAGATIKQTKEVVSQLWGFVAPWVQWAKEKWHDVYPIVYEKASLQGVRTVVAEAGRILLDFVTGRPYKAAYKVAKDVPVVGGALKDIVGEANLRKKANHEDAKEL